jgi:hypothetical protein
MTTHDFGDHPPISFRSGYLAAYPNIDEDILTDLIKEGNEIRIAFKHSK